MTRDEAFAEINAERHNQEFLKGQGRFTKTCADAMPDSMKLTILAEEVGEVARAIQGHDVENLRDELTQVAAVCVAWLESLT